jgi:hypothetical protein
LPIVAQDVMVRIDYESHSPFASLQKTDQDQCGSDQVRFGVLDITCSEPQDMAAGQFLSMLRFEKRGTCGSRTTRQIRFRSGRLLLTPKLIPLRACCAGAKHIFSVPEGDRVPTFSNSSTQYESDMVILDYDTGSY